MLQRRFTVRHLIPVLLAVAAAACSDSPTGIEPAAHRPQFSHGVGVNALLWTPPLTETQTVTKLIPKRGGNLNLPVASLDIPNKALDADTEITLTVPAGNRVEIRFEPHGLFFAKPAVLGIDLGYTQADRNRELQSRLKVYYQGAGGLEEVPSWVRQNTLYVEISHFSGYVVATGEDEGGSGGN